MSKQRFLNKAGLAVSVALMAFPSMARADPDDDDEAKPAKAATEIVVTARRLDVARASVEADLGASTYTLTNEVIENRPGGETTDLGRILLQAPGVAQTATGGIAVRGSRSGVQYRINNVIIPQGVADFGERLSTRLAERTELITGALPAQYGLQVGGVVNVTTKSGAYASGGQAELFGGSHGEVEPAFEYAGASGPTSYFASGSYLKSNAGLSSPGGAADPRHDRTSQIEGFFYGDHVIDQQSRLSLIGGTSNERFQIPGLPGAPGRADLTGEIREGNQYAIASYLRSSGTATLQASLFGLASSNNVRPDVADSLRYAGISRSVDQRRTSVGTQIEGLLKLGGLHTLRGGILVSTEREHGETSTISSIGTANSQRIAERRVAASLFVEDEIKATKRFTINVGLRLDHVGGTGDGARLSPRASIVWAGPGGTTVHAGYARYYVPAPQEPVIDPLMPDSSRQARGETDDYFDGGAEKKVGGLTLGIDAYWREARNLLQERALGASRIERAYNFDRGHLRGIELTTTFQNGLLSAWGNLAVAHVSGTKIVSGQQGFTAAELSYAASNDVPLDLDQRVTASGGAGYRLGRLRLSGDLVYGSGARRTIMGGTPNGTHLPSYARIDLAAVYHVTGLGHRPADVRFDVTNLLDRRYAFGDGTALGGGVPEWGARRGILVGIEQSF